MQPQIRSLTGASPGRCVGFKIGVSIPKRQRPLVWIMNGLGVVVDAWDVCLHPLVRNFRFLRQPLLRRRHPLCFVSVGAPCVQELLGGLVLLTDD